MIDSMIDAKKIPGSPGDDSVAAAVTTYAQRAVMYVTTAGTFSFVTKAGRTRTSVPLPVGLYPVFIKQITAIADSGVAEMIFYS
jgi:hypothetical protein